MPTPATPEQIAARQAEAAIIAGGTPTPPSTSTTTPTPAPAPVAPVVTTSPVTTSSDVRSTFDKNVEKLDSATYAYNNILSPNVTGRTTGTETTPPKPTTTTTTTGTTTGTSTTPTTTGDSEYTKTLKDIELKRKSELDRLDEDAKKRQELYDAMMAKSDAAHKGLLESIKTQFDQTRAKMTDTNIRFNAITKQNQYLINGFRYTPQQSQGMVYDAEQAGLSRLAAIDSQYAEALQKAQTAKDERDYKNLNDLMNNLDKIAQDRRTVLQEMATGAKDIQESLSNVENMSQTQVNMMDNMLEGYGIDVETVPLAERDEWFKEKAKEISDATGVKISPEYVKTQMSRYSKQAQIDAKTPDLQMSEMLGVYVNKKGEPILKDGRQIAYKPDDKIITIGDRSVIVSKDEYGNTIYNYTDGVISGDTNVTGDLRRSAWVSKYPNEASFKNNNPAGFSVNPAFEQYFKTGVAPKGSTAELWSNAGINFFPGAKRPSGEGGQYVAFGTIEDGLRAMELWWSANPDISEKLKTFSVAGYSIPEFAGKNFNQLTEDEKAHFMMLQMKKESPGLYTVLSANMPMNYDPKTDTRLTMIGSSSDGSGLFLDKETNETMTGNEAKAKYGQMDTSSKYTTEQMNVMDNIEGEPTKSQIEELRKNKLTTGDLEEYTKIKRKKGEHTAKDQTFISTINGKIESNAAYKKANTAQTYINNVLLSLDRNTGLGDIAAINQFQKIIDEGAVTRDQDVRLVQSAESLIGKLNIWLKNKKEGDILSPGQRSEIKTIANEMLNVSRKSFENDPVVKSRKKELELRGINPNDTVFGQFSSWDKPTTTASDTDLWNSL